MHIERLSVDRLVPAGYNPRAHLRPGDPDFEFLKKSLDEFGLVEPLVWNKRTGTLVGGHQRLGALIDAGITEVEVSVVDLSLDTDPPRPASRGTASSSKGVQVRPVHEPNRRPGLRDIHILGWLGHLS